MDVWNVAKKQIHILIKICVLISLALKFVADGRFLPPHVENVQIHRSVRSLLDFVVLLVAHLEDRVSDEPEQILVFSAAIFEETYTGLGASPKSHKSQLMARGSVVG